MRGLWTGWSPAHGDRRSSAMRDGVHLPAARELPIGIEVVTGAQGAQAEQLPPRLSSSDGLLEDRRCRRGGRYQMTGSAGRGR